MADVRDLDQLEGGLVQAALELLVAVEVAVGLLDHDVAFQQEPFEHLLDVERGEVGVAGAERDVLEIEVHRHRRIGFFGTHLVHERTAETSAAQRKRSPFGGKSLSRLKVICETQFTQKEFFPVIDALEKQLQPEVRYRATVRGQDGQAALAEFAGDMASFRRFVKERRKFLLQELAKADAK